MYSKFVLIIEESSGLEGTVKLVYMANVENSRYFLIIQIFFGRNQLLSTKDGRDVHGPLPFIKSVDGRLSGCVMYDDVSDAELL